MGFTEKISDFVLHPRTHSRLLGLLVILLLVSIAFANLIVLKQRQEIISTAPSATPNNLDFYPTSAAVFQGKMTSGDYMSLASKDSNFLVIQSALGEGIQNVDWFVEFTLPSQQVSNLSLSYVGKYSDTEGQAIYLYNFAKKDPQDLKNWDLVDNRSVGRDGPAGGSIELPVVVVNPTNYISGGGKVKVRFTSNSGLAFTGYIDYLRLGVKY